MPNYDYQCTDCGHQFEHFQSMNDPKLTTCPECQGQLKRLLGSGSGIIFKGGGFYETDFKNKGKSPSPTPSSGCCGGNCKGKH